MPLKLPLEWTKEESDMAAMVCTGRGSRGRVDEVMINNCSSEFVALMLCGLTWNSLK